MGPKSNDRYPYTEREIWRHIDTHTQRKSMQKQEKLEWCPCKPNNTKYCQRPPTPRKETLNRLSLRAFTESMAYWHFDYRLLPSRTVREYISAILSHPIWATLLQQPWNTGIGAKKWGRRWVRSHIYCLTTVSNKRTFMLRDFISTMLNINSLHVSTAEIMISRRRFLEKLVSLIAFRLDLLE